MSENNGSTITFTVSNPVDLIKEIVATKVDKVEGKDLSTNDYTTEDKTKLNSLYDSYYIDEKTGDLVATKDTETGEDYGDNN